MPLFKDISVELYGMDIRVLAVLDVLDEIFMNVAGRRAIITSAREGTHSPNSLHYKGRALDLRNRDLSAEQNQRVVNLLRSRLGADWDVVVEKDHIHIELDPK